IRDIVEIEGFENSVSVRSFFEDLVEVEGFVETKSFVETKGFVVVQVLIKIK
ncbi:13871_t:CDS:1, partial [Dentiscutata erythropus]